MEHGGVVPRDAPDPRLTSEERLRALAFPVFGPVAQPSITRAPIAGFTDSTDATGIHDTSVSFSHTLWRHPDDHADPRNEIVLDDSTRRSIEEEPPWGRPRWLAEMARLHRYPMLWEAVRTSWHASPDDEVASLPNRLVEHTDHILRNRFREELALPIGPGAGSAWKVHRAAITSGFVKVDGLDRPADVIDTDPFVFAVGLRIDEHVVSTVVLPRDALDLVDLTLTRH